MGLWGEGWLMGAVFLARSLGHILTVCARHTDIAATVPKEAAFHTLTPAAGAGSHMGTRHWSAGRGKGQEPSVWFLGGRARQLRVAS